MPRAWDALDGHRSRIYEEDGKITVKVDAIGIDPEDAITLAQALMEAAGRIEPAVTPIRSAGEAIEQLLQAKHARYRASPSDHLDGVVDGLDLAIGIINDHLPDSEPPIEGADA